MKQERDLSLFEPLAQSRTVTITQTMVECASGEIDSLHQEDRARMVFKLVDGAQKNWRKLDGHSQLPKIHPAV